MVFSDDFFLLVPLVNALHSVAPAIPVPTVAIAGVVTALSRAVPAPGAVVDTIFFFSLLLARTNLSTVVIVAATGLSANAAVLLACASDPPARPTAAAAAPTFTTVFVVAGLLAIDVAIVFATGAIAFDTAGTAFTAPVTASAVIAGFCKAFSTGLANVPRDDFAPRLSCGFRPVSACTAFPVIGILAATVVTARTAPPTTGAFCAFRIAPPTFS